MSEKNWDEEKLGAKTLQMIERVSPTIFYYTGVKYIAIFDNLKYTSIGNPT